MKGNQAGLLRKLGQKAGDVAITDKYFWVPADDAVVQQRQNPVATVTSPRTDNGLDRRVLKHLHDISGPFCGRSGTLVFFQTSAFSEHDVIAHVFQDTDATLHTFRLQPVSGINDTDPGTRSQFLGFDLFCHQKKSLIVPIDVQPWYTPARDTPEFICSDHPTPLE